MSSVINFDETFARVISTGRILVVEGYLWEIPQTVDAIFEACETAHGNGVLVALTASDVSCVTRHRKQFWSVNAINCMSKLLNIPDVSLFLQTSLVKPSKQRKGAQLYAHALFGVNQD